MKQETIDLAFYLLETAPFSVLELQSLLRIAEVAGRQDFEPHDTILPAGQIPERVFIVRSGGGYSSGILCSKIFNIPSLLADRPVINAITAGPQGCSTSVLGKSHMFTIIREFPELIRAMTGEVDT